MLVCEEPTAFRWDCDHPDGAQVRSTSEKGYYLPTRPRSDELCEKKLAQDMPEHSFFMYGSRGLGVVRDHLASVSACARRGHLAALLMPCLAGSPYRRRRAVSSLTGSSRILCLRCRGHVRVLRAYVCHDGDDGDPTGLASV